MSSVKSISQYLVDLNFIDHHSYIMVADFADVKDLLIGSVVRALGQPIDNHPDVWVEFFPSFNIGHSRQFKELQQRRALGDNQKFFIIGLGSISVAAQNALLKVLEEPTRNTHLVLVASSERMFLPTVLSRCKIIKSASLSESPSVILAVVKQFLVADKDKRLRLIADWQVEKKISKSFLLDFVNGLEQLPESGRWPVSVKRAFLTSRKYLYDQALLPKLILEYLAVILPIGR